MAKPAAYIITMLSLFILFSIVTLAQTKNTHIKIGKPTHIVILNGDTSNKNVSSANQQNAFSREDGAIALHCTHPTGPGIIYIIDDIDSFDLTRSKFLPEKLIENLTFKAKK